MKWLRTKPSEGEWLLCVVLLTLAVISLWVGPARADGYYNGYVSEGYTYHDGYWYYNNVPYTRSGTYYSTPGYYSCGYYYPGTSYTKYSYTRYYPPAATYPQQAAAVDYKSGDWRSKLLDIAKARDEYEGQLRKAALEQLQYMEAVKALGLQGNFNYQNYGINPMAYGGYGYGNLNVGNYGINGNTAYGYTFSQLAQSYGSTDLNVLYQQAASLAKGAQDLGGQATTQFGQLAEQAGGNAARVAEILAQGKAAADALANARPAPSTTTVTQVQGVTQQQQQVQQSGQQQGGQAAQAGTHARGVASLTPGQQKAAQSCIRCHSGDAPKGKFDVAAYFQGRYDRQANLAVLGHVTSDPKQDASHMPRLDNGGAGTLPPDLILEFALMAK
jgi:hypothetical protein